MELRKKVAAALARRNYPGGTDADIAEMAEGFLLDADAAIAAVLEAMGEPSEGMVQAAYTASADYFIGDEITGKGFRLAYAAMLTAFRTETLPPDSRGGK